jgi:hypothetical protein
MLGFCAVNLWAILHFLLAARAMRGASIGAVASPATEPTK